MKKGIIINQDADGFIGSCKPGVCTKENLIGYAKQFAGSHVTDYFITLNNTNSTYPSKVMTSLCDKFERRHENGVDVDYSGLYTLQGANYMFKETGLDYIALWCEAFREVGINPWLSFRMNDDHDHDKKKVTSWLLSDFYYEHPEVRRVDYNPEIWQYGDYTLDYSYEIVRNYYLAYISEALDRYDPYGIELDFQRDCHYFGIGKEYDGLEIMNGFVRDVDAIVKKHEEMRGHEIKIAVRVAQTPELSYDIGWDVMTWVQEGIVDMVIPSANWSTTDTDIPVRLWKSLLRPYNVELCPATECNIKCWYGGDRPTGKHTIETYAAMASSFFSQGADKIYMFNYFLWLHNRFPEEAKVDMDPEIPVRSVEGYYSVINTIGDDEFVHNKMNRRHILTYRDITPLSKGYMQQLPKKVTPHGIFKFHIGAVPEGAKLTLKFSTLGGTALENPPKVYVNGILCSYIGNEEKNDYTLEDMVCYEIPKEAHGEFLRPDVCSAVDMTVSYMEIKVEVKLR